MSKVTKFFRGKVRSINPKDFTADVVITDESSDRYKEIVRVDAIKKAKAAFMEHPVMLSSHNYRGLLNQIGHYEKIKVDNTAKEVIATPKWYVGEGNPEADWGWKLAEKGIAAFSIGFIPRKFKEFDEDEQKENKGARGAYEELELLEVSQVLIPANPSALQKSFDEATEQEEKDFIEQVLELCREYEATTEGKKPKKEDDDDDDEDDKKKDDSPEEIAEDKGWEETENEIRHRLKDPGQFEKFRYMSLKKDKPRVNGVYGKFKGKNDWAIQSLRFPKADGWTMAEAKKWVSDHPDLKKDWETVDTVEMLFDIMEHLSSLTALGVDTKAYVLKAIERIEDGMGTVSEKTPKEELAEAATVTIVNAMDANNLAKLLKEHASLIAEALPRMSLQPSSDGEMPVKEVEGPVEEKDMDVDDLLSEEKLNEMETVLRKFLAPDTEIDVDSVRAALDQMTEEVSRVFSSQPKGNG